MNILVKIQKEINKIKHQMSVTESYLDTKRLDRDWHGVWEASIDLKNLEDRLSILEGMKIELLAEVAAKQKGDSKQDVRTSTNSV